MGQYIIITKSRQKDMLRVGFNHSRIRVIAHCVNLLAGYEHLMHFE